MIIIAIMIKKLIQLIKLTKLYRFIHVMHCLEYIDPPTITDHSPTTLP